MLDNTRAELESRLPIQRGSENGSSLKVAVLLASYNTDICQGLLNGCLKGLAQCSVPESSIQILETDGAFECPLLAKRLSPNYDAVICLGAVIKGDTAHFEYVAGPSADGFQQVALETDTPIIFGVLTTYNEEQAKVRSNDDDYNKGYEAALTAVKTANLLASI